MQLKRLQCLRKKRSLASRPDCGQIRHQTGIGFNFSSGLSGKRQTLEVFGSNLRGKCSQLRNKFLIFFCKLNVDILGYAEEFILRMANKHDANICSGRQV